MDSYSLSKPKLKNTYEVETQPYKTDYIPYNAQEELSHRTNQERLSQSPPIILCETTDFRNSRTHRHRYLFYPSASRLSPYTGINNYSNFNIASESRKTDTLNDLDKEINRLREQNRQIKEEYMKRNGELNNDMDINMNNYGKNRGMNRPESVDYNRRKGKYKDLLEKSTELKNSIENLIKEEEGKARGPLGYYNRSGRNNRDNRDNEYDDIINRQKNIFNTTNNNNNGRYNKYNTHYNRNNINDNNNLNNNEYDDQFKSGTLRNRDGSENNYFNNNKNYNNEEEYNDNKKIYSKNNNEEETDYNDNKNIYSKNRNRTQNEQDYNAHKDIYSKNKNRTQNEEDYNNNNINKNENHNEEVYKDNKNIFSKSNNQDYIDNNDSYSNKNNYRTYNNLTNKNNLQNSYNKNDIYLKNKALIQSLDKFSSYNDNNNNNKNYSNNINYSNNNEINPENNKINNRGYNNNEINSENNKRNSRGYNNSNQNINNEINNNNEYENNNIGKSGQRKYLGKISSNESQQLNNNEDNTDKKNKNEIKNIDGIATLPDTLKMGNIFILDKNTDSLMGNNNNNNFISSSQGNNNYKSNRGNYNSNNNNQKENDINDINRNNFNSQNMNENYMNIIDNDNNKLSEDGESGGKFTKLVLADENNMEILSEDRKPFIGEEIQEKKVLEGNKILVLTKGGETIALNILKNYEGEILADEKGNIILGRDNKYFIEKNGELVVSTDKKLLDGDKSVPAKVKKVKLNPSIFYSTFKSNGDNFDSNNNNPFINSYGINNFINGEGLKNSYNNNGMTKSQYRRKYNSKNRFKMFPKGDGDAKPPILKKKKRRFKNKK